jgi:hypothetical protein
MWLVGWFHFITLEWIINNQNLYGNMVAPHLVDLHDITQFVFEHSSLGSKIWEATKEELYNYFC